MRFSYSWLKDYLETNETPERIGEVKPKEIAEEAIFLIDNSNFLQDQRNNLEKERGSLGAVKKLTKLI